MLHPFGLSSKLQRAEQGEGILSDFDELNSRRISRRGFCILLGASANCLIGSAYGLPVAPDAPEERDWSFASPPARSRPYVLWMWMGSNITATGITRDLEAMNSAGIGGATIFSLADTVIPWAGVIGKSPTPEIVTFTEPWWKLLRHAALEAHRLGLELILHNCAGYESSGGPWITPELSLQEVVWSKTPVKGGGRFEGTLSRPVVDLHPHANFPQIFMEELGRVAVPEVPARRDYFKDIAVIALPVEGVVSRDNILILSDRVDAQGVLRWDAPAGDWMVYRFGHTTTGAMIQPAQRRAMGLECDKMSKEAVTFHVQHVLDDMQAHLGDMMGKGITTLYFDSYEAGVPTWTPKMAQEFESRRGYDAVPWLPVLAGRTLGSAEETAKFKQDFKRTTYDLFRDCYWATPGPLAHAAGLKFVAEPYDGPWVIDEVVGFLDTPAVEFWTHNGVYSPVSVEPVMHAAHRLGKQLIASEAFTSDPKEAHWYEHPAWLKPIGDAAFCAGINRFNLHHCVQQPWADKYKPGNTMGQWGVHFGRNQTWWEPGKAWIEYLWRCQNLLQRGTFVEPSVDSSALVLDVIGEPGAVAKPELKSVRRNIGNAVVFFVANIGRVSGIARLQFPVSDLQPEVWDPVWGTMKDLAGFERTGKVTSLQLAFAEAQSFFIVFRNPSRRMSPAKSMSRNVIATLRGSWDVKFDPSWGGPEYIELPELTDWTQHANAGVRFYSGTAVYRKRLHLAKAPPASGLWLDIGICHHLAEVIVNGKRLGVIWTAPWRIDVSVYLRRGENVIEIAVTNVWANRLIGDEQQPADVEWQVGDPSLHTGDFLKEFPDWFIRNEPRPSRERYTFTTWNYFKKDSPLVPSGLLGPVRLLQES
jgi:hypothetical protein